MSAEKLCDESVWSEQLEEAFHEALNLYPSGRKKIILTDAGKMYGKKNCVNDKNWHLFFDCLHVRTK